MPPYLRHDPYDASISTATWLICNRSVAVLAPGAVAAPRGRARTTVREPILVLYGGRTVVPFGERLATWPIASLWS
jgi:hypothetical protein